MAINKKFLTSVADVYAYDTSDNILFTGKTLLDSSIEVSLGSAPVRGGRGNQLQYIYYHTGEMKFTLTDTQWNLGMLGATVGVGGSDSEDGFELGNFYKEETVAMTGASGSVSELPLAFAGTTIYGWATDPNGATQKVTMNAVGTSGGSFSVSGSVAGNWCVRYYTANLSQGKSFTIKANMIPKVVKLVMETQLNSSDATTNKIGIVQVIAPSVNLSGAFSISMKSDGVSNTPLTGTALAYTESSSTGAGCSTDPYYAKIVEIIDNTTWYSNLVSTTIVGGNFTLGVGDVKTLTVYGIPSTGNAFKIPNAQLSFFSSNSASAVAGLHSGSVGGVAAGTATISAWVTSASPTVPASTAVVTVVA